MTKVMRSIGKFLACISLAVVVIGIVVSAHLSTDQAQTGVQSIDMPSALNAFADSEVDVIASFYPLYEFARNVGGEKVEVKTLIPLGIEPHDWEPTSSDVQKLNNADVFVYNGGGFEPWIERIPSSDLGQVKLVETAEGVEFVEVGEEQEEHEHEGTAIDPHVWLDPVRAKLQVALIADALMEVDPENAEYYEENAKAYSAKLDALHLKIRSDLSGCKNNTFVSFHKAFGYFAERYGLHEISLGGIVPEMEVTSAKLRELVDLARVENVKVIYYEELMDPRLAEILASEIGAQVLPLSPIEGLTGEELNKGVTYLEKMEQNLENLKVGLECR